MSQGYTPMTIETGPKVSSDYPNYMHVEMAVNERPGNDTGGPGFLQDQNTFERN